MAMSRVLGGERRESRGIHQLQSAQEATYQLISQQAVQRDWRFIASSALRNSKRKAERKEHPPSLLRGLLGLSQVLFLTKPPHDAHGISWRTRFCVKAPASRRATPWSSLHLPLHLQKAQKE